MFVVWWKFSELFVFGRRASKWQTIYAGILTGGCGVSSLDVFKARDWDWMILKVHPNPKNILWFHESLMKIKFTDNINKGQHELQLNLAPCWRERFFWLRFFLCPSQLLTAIPPSLGGTLSRIWLLCLMGRLLLAPKDVIKRAWQNLRSVQQEWGGNRCPSRCCEAQGGFQHAHQWLRPSCPPGNAPVPSTNSLEGKPRASALTGSGWLTPAATLDWGPADFSCGGEGNPAVLSQLGLWELPKLGR